MKFRRREAAHMEVPAPRGGESDAGPSEAQLARVRAERALAEEVERTEAVKAETPRITGLGDRLDRIYATNHIREDVVGGLLKAIQGGV